MHSLSKPLCKSGEPALTVACACLLLLAAACAGERPVATADLEALRITHESFVLDNGLTVILKESRRAPVGSFWVWYRVGSRNERAGITGISHLFEHMMFRGTEKYPADAYNDLADAVLAAGWSEEALYDAVIVCAAFNMMNRIVEGCGVVPTPEGRADSESRHHAFKDSPTPYTDFGRAIGIPPA